ncbi:Tim10/DDP family zinc finger-domain-containing protein [Gaertneriomyces semiglobifer]|nr:Tim10/DDP family zinc finger-domain-containing protein [Gaertneriomyces semiglobifer]
MNFGGRGDQAQMMALIEQKQMKDFLHMYSTLVDRCFRNCVNDFTSTALSSEENSCIDRCFQKFIKHSERVGFRFSEENILLQHKQEKDALQQQQQQQAQLEQQQQPTPQQ